MLKTIVRPFRAVALLCALVTLAVGLARAQEQPGRRLASIVGVAVEEYAKGIDDRGRLISQQEYDEAVGFLRDARAVADRLSGEQAAAIRAPLDSLTAAVAAKRPPADLKALHARFVAALGSEGTLELPKAPLNVAAGRALFERNCASCHGERGMGDGVAARTLSTQPAHLGDAKEMAGSSPALLYRVISVGVSGTAMPPWGNTLTSQDRWNIVAYLHAMRTSQAQLAEGEGLYMQRCASCHGALGAGDGGTARSLSKLPTDIGTLAWQAERSDSEIAAVVRRGMPGTPMPGARDLSDDDVAKIVAYLRSLPVKRAEVASPAAVASNDTSANGIARTVIATLDQSLAALQSGRADDANDRAADAYMAFEPLEQPARAKKAGLVTTMEGQFADFRGAIRAGDARGAERLRDALAAQMPEIVDLTQRASSPWTAFLQSFLIILREGFEAILVIGAVAAFLRKTGNESKLRSIWIGALVGLVASAATAVVLATILHAVPASGEIIEGASLLVAVCVLFSVSYWLISKVEAAKWQQFIREKVSAALEHGGGGALVLVAFLAVYREGAETALFYQALFGEGPNVAVPLTLGILVGFAALAVIFTLFFRFGVRIPLRPFFTATSALLYLMAFVFAGKGVRELQEGSIVPITIIPHMPSIDALGIFPTLETLVAQLILVVLLVFALVKTFWPRRSVALPTTPGPDAERAARHTADQDAAIEQLSERVARIERAIEGAEDSARFQ